MKRFPLILSLLLCFLGLLAAPQQLQSQSKRTATIVSALIDSPVFASQMVATMKLYVGHKEVTPNRSPIIDKMCAVAGVPVGSYWCAAFTYYCAQQTAKRMQRTNPLPRTASVSAMLKKSAAYGSGLTIVRVPDYGNEPVLQIGDIGCIKKGSTYGDADIGSLWQGHQYTVQSQSSADKVKTLEGNASANGSRNGDRVAELWRNPKLAVAFIRIPPNAGTRTA